MNNRKSTGRRIEDAATRIKVNSPANVDAESSEIQRAMRELKKGKPVLMAPAAQYYQGSSQAELAAQMHAKRTRTGIVTALTGGTALGLTSLAVAPAAIGVAAVVAAIGAALGGVASRLDASAQKEHA
jgi:hypothetical protein